jgi:hypothetical protein
MPLDFPSNPTNGQIYEDYYYDASIGAWNSLGGSDVPNILSNGVFTASSGTTVPLTVNGTSGQSANLQEWKSQAGATLASMSANGGLSLNTPLSIQNGGTGANTSLDARTNLEITPANIGAALASHTHAATAINSGTLDVARLPSGTIIQSVSYSYNTNVNGTGTTYTDIHSGTRPAITAKRSDSKFVILASMNWLQEGTRRQVLRCLRDGTAFGTEYVFPTAIGSGWTTANMFFQWENTAARTAGVTYTFSFQTAVTAGTWYYNYDFGGLRGTSTYTILEVVS